MAQGTTSSTDTTASDVKAADGGKHAEAGNTATHGDHDRVAMLSLRADGTPDQLNPEFIGDPAQTLAATTEQFRQQAVSAADTAAAAPTPAAEEDAVQDPTVAELTGVHEQAASDAEKAAEQAVKDLTA